MKGRFRYDGTKLRDSGNGPVRPCAVKGNLREAFKLVYDTFDTLSQESAKNKKFCNDLLRAADLIGHSLDYLKFKNKKP